MDFDNIFRKKYNILRTAERSLELHSNLMAQKSSPSSFTVNKKSQNIKFSTLSAAKIKLNKCLISLITRSKFKTLEMMHLCI